jgi:hypothetical protein
MRLALLLGLITLLSACQSATVQRLTKAKPAPVSRFLDQRLSMQPIRHRLPFHFAWWNTDPEVQAAVSRATEIYIAPVDTRYLRPISKTLAAWEVRNGITRPGDEKIAYELRRCFQKAFWESPAPRFRLVNQPGPRSIILELAITELNPTSVQGNVVKTAAKFLVGPLSMPLGLFTKGNIAIEGKVTLPGPEPRVSFLQFSDQEKDKMTFYSARDFQPYAHALVAADEWAEQFEEFTRTHPSHKVDESSFITLKPW